MKLFEVTNGFMGESYVKVFVIANSQEKARELATEKYKNEAAEKYNSSYFENLKIECICEDTTKEWATDPRDC